MKTLDTTHKIYTAETANAMVAELNATDDWTYEAIPNPNPEGPKTAIIKVYDEDGEFVSLLNL